MKRTPLYSRSDRRQVAAPPPAADTTAAPAKASPAIGRRSERLLLLGAAALLVVVALLVQRQFIVAPRAITQKDIDRAVLHTLANENLPSPAARAAEAVRRSVVRVRGLSATEGGDEEEGVGSGVVIVDTGLILTNLHVAAGAAKLQIEFADGLKSDATVVATRPEHDLAVIQAKTLPDDLAAATLRSTADLAPGDQVVAVGFPFGIGPSVSAGVVSGLQREFRSPEGERVLTNLIQFDTAANPGSSGGPLVTMDGAVVGIVTGILNPTEHRVFIGIGFAVPIENAAAAVGIHPF